MTETHTETVGTEPEGLRRRLVTELAEEYGPLRGTYLGEGGGDVPDWHTAVRDVVIPIVYDHYATNADTAAEQPLPSVAEMPTEPVEPGALDGEQRQRVNALREARAVLERRSGTHVFSSAPATQVDATDLHSIATYIVTGDDPWVVARPSRRRWWRRG